MASIARGGLSDAVPRGLDADRFGRRRRAVVCHSTLFHVGRSVKRLARTFAGQAEERMDNIGIKRLASV